MSRKELHPMKTKEPLVLKQARAAYATARRMSLTYPADTDLRDRATDKLAQYYALKLKLAVESALALDADKLPEADRIALAGRLILGSDGADAR